MNKKIISISLLVLLSVTVIFFFRYLTKPVSDLQIPSLLPRTDSNNSAEYLEAYKSVEYYKEQIKLHPETVKNYVELAQIFLQEARITGRHHEYIPVARKLLDKALNINPANFDAKVAKASILMTLHQFQKAMDEISEAIKSNQYSAAAYGVLVDALVELGRYDEAVKACDKMIGLRPDLRSYARASYLRELFGQNDAAVKAMIMAADAGQNGQENRAWTLYNLGNLFLNEGKLDSAQFVFNGILQERGNYDYALCGLADIDALKSNYSEALEYYVKAAQSSSNHIITEKLADLYKVMGMKENEKEMVTKVLESFRLHELDGFDIDLEYARFCANHDINLKEALSRIENEFSRRPNNIDILDAYSWTLFKIGKHNEAVPLIQKAMHLNSKRALLHYHAAVIYNSINDNKSAYEYLTRSFKENPYVDILTGADARKMSLSFANYASLK
jgi:pentatricopeptide repeat protein